MEQGIYGFPPGKNITVDIQEFESSGIWNKPNNAKLCFVQGTGGGQGANASSSTSGTTGGAAGCAYQITLMASILKQQETVTIGSGGAGGIAPSGSGSFGGDTIFAEYYWAGGGGNANARNPWTGVPSSPTWGSAGTFPSDGRHGAFGGGGGGSGSNLGASGRSGGRPRSWQFGSSTSAESGGGAPGGTVSSPAGTDSRLEYDVDGYGEGAGGGYGGPGGNGGNGRRGAGGGGAGQDTSTNSPGNNGGAGGDGYLKIITYCWE